MPLLKIRDKDGKIYEVQAFKSDSAPPDLSFNPQSENAQSGIAVAEAIEGLLAADDITVGVGEPDENTSGKFYFQIESDG